MAEAFTESVVEADFEREKELARDSARRRLLRKRKSKSARHANTDDEETDDDARSDSPEPVGARDKHVFRVLAREKPGYIFFKNAADARAALGQRHMDLDVSNRGGIHRRWFDGYFEPKNRQKIHTRQAELIDLLVTSLDHLVAGRCLEAADTLAAQLRSVVYGIETGEWRIGKEMLAFKKPDHSLVDNEWIEAAVKEADKAAKRQKKIADLHRRFDRPGPAGR